jgi:hypothetical protein
MGLTVPHVDTDFDTIARVASIEEPYSKQCRGEGSLVLVEVAGSVGDRRCGDHEGVGVQLRLTMVVVECRSSAMHR